MSEASDTANTCDDTVDTVSNITDDDGDVVIVDDSVSYTDESSNHPPPDRTFHNQPSSPTSLHAQLQLVSAEMRCVDQQIERLQHQRQLLAAREKQLQEKYSRLIAEEESRRCDWQTGHFSWSERLKDVAGRVFGVSEFRSMQMAALNATLSARDLLLVMPTGAGKSLCYQLPALVEEPGVTLVVAPLVALMQDQVFSLRRRGVKAEMFSAGESAAHQKLILQPLCDPSVSVAEPLLLYVTPEKLAKSKRLMSKLQQIHRLQRLRRIAVDEVHCCSQWGHDFRPDYRFLGVLSTMFAGVPLLGLTATASETILRDVRRLLHVPRALTLRAAYDRPNLFYEVMEKPAVADQCVSLLVSLLTHRFSGQSGIVYTTTVRDCEWLAGQLVAAGVPAAAYHAQLSAEQRSRVHVQWLQLPESEDDSSSGLCRVVVATVAFGMGIDKPDVRFVIHHCLAKSMDAYYQESGRAGRDGSRADCLLLYRLADVFRLSTMVFADGGEDDEEVKEDGEVGIAGRATPGADDDNSEQLSTSSGLKKLYAMLRYCVDTSGVCRRRLLAETYGDNTAVKCEAMCDRCSDSDAATQSELVDISDNARQVAGLLHDASVQEVRLTAAKLLDRWQPSSRLSARLHAERLLAYLLLRRHVCEQFVFTPYSTISYLGAGVRQGRYPLMVRLPVGSQQMMEDAQSKKARARKRKVAE